MMEKGRYNYEAARRNMRNSLAKKIPQNGAKNHQCKLTHEQASICKACPDKRGNAIILAKKFKVSLTVVADIRNGKRWTHLPNPSADDFERAKNFIQATRNDTI